MSNKDEMTALINGVFITDEGEELYKNALERFYIILDEDEVIDFVDSLIKQCGPAAMIHLTHDKSTFNSLMNLALDIVKFSIDYDIYDRHEIIFFIRRAMIKQIRLGG